MNTITESNTQTPTLQRNLPQLDYILLDDSGSMMMKLKESYAAIDNYVAQLRDQNIDSTASVCMFSNYVGSMVYRKVRESTPTEWTDMQYDVELQSTGGGTPLYDSINVMCRELSHIMPKKCSILIITDGEENASKTTAEQARALLDWCRGNGWQITFLGCDFENSQQAKLLGANDANAIGVRTQRLADATSLLAEKRARYALYGTEMDMTKDEKDELGGLIPDMSAK